MSTGESKRIWRRLNSRKLLDCSPWFSVFVDRWKLPDGRVLDDFHRIEARGYLLVVAIDDAERVLVLRGYRPGCEGVVLQLPGGYLDEGETAVLGAQRELQEETGYTAQHWTPLGCFSGDGNWKCSPFHCFLARGLRELKTGKPMSDDPDEQEVLWLSLGQAKEAWLNGQFNQVAATAALGLAFGRLSMSPQESV